MRPPVVLLPCFLALAACNATRTDPPPVAAAPGSTTIAALPAGSSCSAAIARYRVVAKSDADTGNASASVYAQIDAEIRNAENACAAGRDAEARGLIAASKGRHGYPGGA